ncbi:phosphatase 2C-like domain-containing protein [Tribonema minus]|uniref:Phosphatase 2C-like domain-containing protein n=1 Tax=Tribonema minus TaxID=303371 RepID=A0A835Z963_9STRA|nr:phosphatase 2C-like domain-containing protein [Tribonema minus]
MWVANCGDSRAVAAAHLGGGGEEEVKSVQLTEDQTPDVPEERERILGMGGFVSPPPQPGLSSRVWLDAQQTMVGLAMSRSLGDLAVKRVGVVPDPVVTAWRLTRGTDLFLLLASDGIWTFVSTDEAVELVHAEMARGAGGGRQGGGQGGTGVGAAAALAGACEALVSLANARWAHRVGVYRDDISALLIALQPSDKRASG